MNETLLAPAGRLSSPVAESRQVVSVRPVPTLSPWCPICHQRGCHCNHDLGPFNLYNHHRAGCGAFCEIELAVACASLQDAAGLGPCIINDRHGCPVKLA